MNYIRCGIDANGLYNNGLHVYEHKIDISNGVKTETLAPVDWNKYFIITDAPLGTAEQLRARETLNASKDITPKQLNNIIFFEQLKAFRR